MDIHSRSRVPAAAAVRHGRRPLPARARSLPLLALMSIGIGLSAGMVQAHGAYPVANQVLFDPEDDSRIMVASNIGILRSEDGGASWAWTCMAAYGSNMNEHPHVALLDWNTIVVARQQGLSLSNDGGCSWQFPEQLAGRWVTDIQRAPGSDRLYAVASSREAPSALFVSDDRGAGWSAVGPAFPGTLLRSLLLPHADPELLYLAAVEVTDSAAERPAARVLRSTDRGASWQPLPFPLADGEVDFLLLGSDPGDADRLWAFVPGGRSNRVAISDDGGKAWRDVLEHDAGITHFAATGDQQVFIGSEFSGMFRSQDNGASFEHARPDLNIHCLAARQDELWVCAGYVTADYELGRSTDGAEAIGPVLRFDDFLEGRLSLAACPGAELEAVCEPQRAEVESLIEQAVQLRAAMTNPEAGGQAVPPPTGGAPAPPDPPLPRAAGTGMPADEVAPEQDDADQEPNEPASLDCTAAPRVRAGSSPRWLYALALGVVLRRTASRRRRRRRGSGAGAVWLAVIAAALCCACSSDARDGAKRNPVSGDASIPESAGAGQGSAGTPGAAGQPAVDAGDAPGAGTGEQPGAGTGEQPGAGMGEQPSAGMGEQPSAGMGEQPSAGAGGTSGAGAGSGAGGAPAVDVEPRFSSIYMQILKPTCGGFYCHENAGSGDLYMPDAQAAYDALVSHAASANCEGWMRVVPNDPDQSLVIQKLTSPPCGARMPKDKPALDAALIEVIREWIERGAAND